MKQSGGVHWVGLLLILLVGRAIGSVVVAADPAPAREPTPLAQRAYVWQRVWTAQLCRDLREHAASFNALDVLAAEVCFGEKQSKTEFAKPNWPLVKAISTTVGVVVRISRRERPWRDAPADVEDVVQVSARVLKQVREERIEPSELQIDYDAATSQLADYGFMLRQLRAELGSVRLVVTALPTWLTSPEFVAVAEVADAYVLQVHSLDRPLNAGEPISLFDPHKSRSSIQVAETLGYPFRIALPAYGYRIGFARDGHFLGLQAEGAARAWPAETTLKEVWAEPAQAAGLVAEVRKQRPRGCQALSWFRFPCEGDDLAWRWQTLELVMRGEIPKSALLVELVPREPGTVDLRVKNSGSDRTVVSPQRVAWKGGALITGDGVSGWSIERRGANELLLIPVVTETALRPGEALSVGWLRLSAPAESIETVPLEFFR